MLVPRHNLKSSMIVKEYQRNTEVDAFAWLLHTGLHNDVRQNLFRGEGLMMAVSAAQVVIMG